MKEKKDLTALAEEAREKYIRNKLLVMRRERRQIWNRVCQDLFREYGQSLGYRKIFDFKKDLKKAYDNLLRRKRKEKEHLRSLQELENFEREINSFLEAEISNGQKEEYFSEEIGEINDPYFF